MYNYSMINEPHALPHTFQPGDRVETDCGAYRHVGTVSERRWIYANSRKYGQLCEVSPFEFSAGRGIENEGFLGIRTRFEVLQHLRAKLGSPYRILDNNCEHTNNEAHGLGRWSPQIENIRVILFGVSVGLCFIAAGKK